MADEELYKGLLAKHLPFYESLRNRSRRPKTAAQRQFQDVAWGLAEPVTDHEKAFVYHLTETGRHATLRATPKVTEETGIPQYPAGCHPIPSAIAEKWDEEWVN